MENTRILLNSEDIALLIQLLNEKETKVNNAINFNKNISFGIVDKLIGKQTPKGKEETIKLLVKSAISRLIGVPSDQIADDDSLSGSLDMSAVQVRSLAMVFTFIARKYKPGVVITADECEEQDTVQDCVDLIISKTA